LIVSQKINEREEKQEIIMGNKKEVQRTLREFQDDDYFFRLECWLRYLSSDCEVSSHFDFHARSSGLSLKNFSR
jgi:hypothetical protein